MVFENLLGSIRRGELVMPAEFMPYLSIADRKERGYANLKLAEAYVDIGDIHQAGVFIKRVWVLSEFSPDILSLYVKIHAALGDIDSIRAAYKTLGMKEAAKGNIVDALNYFNQWQYAYANHLNVDKYIYDFDILSCIKQMAEHWRFRVYTQKDPLPDRRIRLAYLLFGILHMNSVLIKINCMLAKYHNKEQFEIAFFIPDAKHAVNKYKQAQETIHQLQSHGCKVVLAPSWSNGSKRLRLVASQIYDYQPDILITSAMLADLEHYFIASLRPAPLIVGLIQGPPQQFAAPDLDWGIAWSKHPLIDTPCDSSLVHIGLDLPVREAITPFRKEELNIPDKSLIAMSAGRHVKFENPDFWKAVVESLALFRDVYYVAVGISREQLPFLDKLLSPELAERILLLGWREDCLNILCLADVLIDTYPSGGGHVLIDAMSLGIPFVSFENNYMRNFDQVDWSVADEFVNIPELIVKRGDFEQFKGVLAKLLSDDSYRRRMGNLCREQIHQSMGKPEQGVREYEDILANIAKNKLGCKTLQINVDVEHASAFRSKVRNMFSRFNKRRGAGK